MEIDGYIEKPCSSHSAFEFIPKRKTKRDLADCLKRLEKEGAKIEADTPFLLIAKIDGRRISLFPNGKILVKGCEKREEAERVACKVIGVIEK